MPVHFKKKINKMRGTKSCGYGMKKKHRGGGSRGGRGKAGFGKHKFGMMLKTDPDHFTKKGFTLHRKKKILCVNVSQLEKMSQDGRVVFNGKVLGSGKIMTALTVVASSVTQKAREKIEAANGKVEVGSEDKKKTEKSE
jgi:large subunit ribosomal protein L15